jgi:RNA recognition motif-containing protein
MMLYIGNLDYRISEEDLYELFSEYGHVTSVRIVRDKISHRSKGFGFVEMEHDFEANRAVDNANGLFVADRKMVVRFGHQAGGTRTEKRIKATSRHSYQ